MIFSVILAITAVVYVAQMLWLRMGLARADAASPRRDFVPFVSIIVAARNEEEFIGACLASLLRIDYPAGRYEIIVVNDGSTDRTAEIMEEALKGHPNLRLHTSRPGEAGLRGKTNAIAQGIELARGEILMFTDADCTVPPTWVSATVKYFDERVGVVGGFTRLEAANSFERIQAFDWLYLFGLASAMTGWRMPLSVIGNNLSVRRKAYEETGGFAKIPFSVTEDYALVQAILGRTGFEVRFPLDKDALVVSKPCHSLRQLYRQKQRWGVGGLDMVPPGLLISGVVWLMRAGLLLSCATMPPVITASVGTAMFLADLYFLSLPLRRFGIGGGLWSFALFEIYFTFYSVLIPFVAFFSRSVVWKERKL